MTRTISSLEEIVAYFDEQVSALKADQLATQAVAVCALSALLDRDWEIAEVLTHARAQLGAVRFDSGDAELNERLMETARHRLEEILVQIAQENQGRH